MVIGFDYEYGGSSKFGNIYRPVAKVTFTSPTTPDKIVDVWMIVDTGADYSILPRHLSEKLRVSLESDCMKDVTYGIGGQSSIYFLRKKIKAQIGSATQQVPLAFLDSNEVPPLLGRQGFIELFDTQFLKSHRVVFNP